MKQQLNNLRTTIQRPIALIAAVVLLSSSLPGVVLAAAVGGQVQYRELRMSDSAASGTSITTGVGSGTNVTYRVVFRAATSYNLKGVILDFCKGYGASTNGTPFIGDSNCPVPVGFSIPATPTVDTSSYTFSNNGAPNSTYDGIGTTGDWTASSVNSGQTFKMSNGSGTPVALTAGTTYSFSVSGITNPSLYQNLGGTFYARLITYTDTSNGSSYDNYTHGTPGTYQDYGGFALSTTLPVQITAKVQETLAFCVSGTTDISNPYPTTTLVAPDTCSAATAPSIILGHGDNQTLDTSQVDRNTVWTLLSTNALRGATIRMHNSNICGGLSTDNGTTCSIPAIGSGAATAGAMAAGTAAFGMFCYDSEAGPIGGAAVVGNVNCDSNYRNASHVTFPSDMYFGMDTTSTAENVIGPFGDTVAASTAPVSNARNRYDFAATASNTTPAGIYKANMSMIASGTF